MGVLHASFWAILGGKIFPPAKTDKPLFLNRKGADFFPIYYKRKKEGLFFLVVSSILVRNFPASSVPNQTAKHNGGWYGCKAC